MDPRTRLTPTARRRLVLAATGLLVGAGLAMSWKLDTQRRAELRKRELRAPPLPSAQERCTPRTDAGALVQRVLQGDKGIRQECDCDDRGCCRCY